MPVPQVSYEAAMGTISAMFPHLDRYIITAVLESQGGAMEPTIEILLDMSGETTSTTSSQQASHPPGLSAPDHHNIPEHSNRNNNIATSSGSISNTHSSQYAQSNPYWVDLPPDFLVGPDRIASSSSLEAAPHPPVATNAYPSSSVDEQIAIMLQNELIFEEVRRDPELARYLLENPEYAENLGLTRLPNYKNMLNSAIAASGGHSRPHHSQNTSTPHEQRNHGSNNSEASKDSLKEKVTGFTLDIKSRFDALASKFKKNSTPTVPPTRGVPMPGLGSTPTAAASPAAKPSGFKLFERRGYNNLHEDGENEANETDGFLLNSTPTDVALESISVGTPSSNTELGFEMTKVSGSNANAMNDVESAENLTTSQGRSRNLYGQRAPTNINSIHFNIDDEEDDLSSSLRRNVKI